VAVAWLGGLGFPAAIYLASAGIGHLTLVDCDLVELPNLNRQVLHWEEDTFPVFGTTPAFIAALLVAEAIKLLAGFGVLLTKLKL